MMRRVLPIPLLAALLLLTTLASGVAQGQMVRDGIFASLGICADDTEAMAPCLDCALVGGLPGGGTASVSSRARGIDGARQDRDLFVAGRAVSGGGARAPPDWV